MVIRRRSFNKILGSTILATALGCKSSSEIEKETPSVGVASSRYQLSLAQWSVHRNLHEGKLDNLDFASFASQMGFTGVEYVSSFLGKGLNDPTYWTRMNEAAEQAKVKQLLIMTDLSGSLGASYAKDRKSAIEEHYPWLDAANELGCHSIRVNLWGEGTRDQQLERCSESLMKLCTTAKDQNLNIIVENHGGYSSDAQWLVQVMKNVNMENCGTLPDFGNFCIARRDGDRWSSPCVNEYDRYKGIEELIPYAKAVSAKSHAFDRRGNELFTDYTKMMDIIHKSDYEGYIGVEFEGDGISEKAGIRATKALLERVIDDLES